MAYKIKVNRRFEVKVTKTYEYIVKEWGYAQEMHFTPECCTN
jgi:hypothetical protein